ncbi:MAG TPA: tripartite tricarboxylate transporter substrate binding protein [Burkholderiales bacterium]|nr:tripartite tricarboxylate transporter substrate binding protein [Burkholderiales bacterium]
MKSGITLRLVCTAVLAIAAGGSLAQGYPGKPVRIVVPSSAGGGTDIVARIIAPKLTERLGQQFIIDNRPGAGTMIGIELAAKSPPDGYTLLVAPSTLALNAVVYKKVPYDAQRDFAPITQLVGSTSIIVVHPSLPPRTVKELIAFARARPGQLNYASAGIGTYPHMTMELFNSMAGLKMVHIPYKGTAPAMVDMLAGHVTVMAATILTGMPQIRAGRLRPLGITSLKRSAAAPEIPTVSESGLPGFESVQWYGALAPVQTSKEIVARLHAEIIRVLQLPDIKERFLADGTDPVGNTPEEFGRYIRDETVKWTKVARDAGIKPE